MSESWYKGCGIRSQRNHLVNDERMMSNGLFVVVGINALTVLVWQQKGMSPVKNCFRYPAKAQPGVTVGKKVG